MSEFLSNDDESLARAMDRWLRRASQASWAIAYIRESFLTRLSGPLNDFERRGGELRILTGQGQGITEAAALELLMTSKSVHVRVYAADGVTFHPKLYLFSNGGQGAIVGSANLSQGAFSTNVEVAAEITSESDPDFVQRSGSWFESVWQRSAPLTAELIEWFRSNQRPDGDDREFNRLVREEAEGYAGARFGREELFRLSGEYSANELSTKAQVSTQGGIRYRGSVHGEIARCVIITGSGHYKDDWDGTDHLVYTGEGLIGDQTLTRGNLVLSLQADRAFPLHVFKKTHVNRYHYAGQFRVLATSEGTQEDEDGRERRVYLFELTRLG
jgi:HKD family nuclease